MQMEMLKSTLQPVKDGFAGVFAALGSAFNLHCHHTPAFGLFGTRDHVSCGLVTVVTIFRFRSRFQSDGSSTCLLICDSWDEYSSCELNMCLQLMISTHFLYVRDILNISQYHNYVYVKIMAIMVAVLMTIP